MEEAWLGTSMSAPGLSTLAVSAVSLALICVRIVAGVALFAHKLPRRRHFAGRVAGIALVVVAVYVLAWALAIALGSLSPTESYLVQFLVFSLVLAVCVAGLLVACDTSVWTALFCVTAGYTVQNLGTGATELVASLLRAADVDPSALPVYLANDVTCLVVVYGACHLLMARRMDREGLTQMEDHQMLLMMPVVSLVIIGFDVLIKSLTGEGLALGYVVALRLFHGIACVTTLWVEYQMLYRIRSDQERSATERLLAERERQYRLSRENIDAINLKCHDIRHQIRSLASGGAVVDGAALADIEREVSVYDSAVKTGNDALDTILTEKRLLCERQGITLTCMADGAALGFMAPADLYALFGNALDNAIEAVGELDDPARRSVSLVVRRAMGTVSIHVENYFAGERRFSPDGMPQTTKADRASHGFGTRSMRAIAERYGGTLVAEAADGVFTLDVMIPLG